MSSVWRWWVFVLALLLDQAAAQPIEGELTRLGAVALDDRRSEDDRAEALAALGASGSPEVAWILRAAAQDRLEGVQRAALESAARLAHPEGVGVLEWVLTDRASPRDNRDRAVELLAAHGSEEAARALWRAAADRRVSARLRGQATAALEARYPATLAALGPPRTVVDPLGGATFVLANGLAGGVALSSVGVWGQFSGSEAIGAVGGSAIGLGAGALVVGARPLTSGQGLAYASGVGWGLATGAWTTSTVHGPWAWLPWGPERARAVDLGAAYRLVGVASGATAGALWMRSDPRFWDVVEVDLAGYLGSAVALAGTALVVWDPEPPPSPYHTVTPTGPRTGGQTTTHPGDAPDRAWNENHRQEARILSGATLIGAAGGLAAGFALNDVWELSWEDAAFATTLGLEAAWIGNWTPDMFGVDDTWRKGTVRLPWNAAIIGGLALAEVHPMPAQTTAVTATMMFAGNGVGAGIPLLVDPSDEQLLARVMVPVGAAGTTAGVLAAPWFDPGEGEWTMTGVGTAIAASHGAMIGTALVGRDVMVPDQVGGLTALLAGTAPPALLALGHQVDPRVDHVVTLGAAFAWGTAYGAATPYALRLPGEPADIGLTATVTGDVFLAGVGLALTDRVGLEPRHTLLPQLSAVAGGTVGALGTAMFDVEPQSVVLGGVIGTTVGMGTGAVITALHPPRARGPRVGRLRVGGQWQPLVVPSGPGEATRYGIQVHGW